MSYSQNKCVIYNQPSEPIVPSRAYKDVIGYTGYSSQSDIGVLLFLGAYIPGTTALVNIHLYIHIE